MKPDGDIRIRAGSLRHQIIIYTAPQPTSPPTYNAAGQALVKQIFAGGPGGPPLMASIGPDRSSLTVRAGQQVTETITPIVMRYLPGLLSSMTITQVSTGDQYQIQGITDVDRRRVVMEVACILFGNENAPTSATN